MSIEYDKYLKTHKACVMQAYKFLEAYGILPMDCTMRWQLEKHDDSKYSEEEYDAYDMHFYGDAYHDDPTGEDFMYAFLHHLHNNPHHWQYWVLIQDANEDHEEQILKMPRNYVREMVCDWWSFSWAKYNESNDKKDLYEIFDWWDKSKDQIKLHPDTRRYVEQILRGIDTQLSMF